MLIKKNRKVTLLNIILSISVILVLIYGIGVGTTHISIKQMIVIFLGKGSEMETFVLISLRLPRMIIVLLSGMSLALSGAILQTLTRNDLADPGIIGINTGAGLGITLFYLFVDIRSESFSLIIPIVGFIGAMLTAALIYWIAYDKLKGIDSKKIIIAGIGCTTALSGFMTILISSAERTKVEFITKWLVGNVWGTSWIFVLAIIPWIIILFPLIFSKLNTLNILQLSEPLGISVGLNMNRERTILLFAAVSLAAVSASIVGGISFIGLIAPHLSKQIVGTNHRNYLFINILIGGLLLLISDLIGRQILQPIGIPTGIVMAIIGAPYFIYLLVKKK